MNAQSARSDTMQTVTWSVAPQNFALDSTSGTLDVAPGARASSQVKVTAPNATGNYTLTFNATSSVGANPPTFVLPVVVK